MVRTFVFILGGLFIWYFAMPSFVGPLGGLLNVATLPILIGLIWSAIECGKEKDNTGFMITIIGIVILILVWFGIWLTPYFNVKANLVPMAGEVVVVENQTIISPSNEHIIQIREDAGKQRAASLMDRPATAMGLDDMGSVFKVGTLNKQPLWVNGELRSVLVGPIEYKEVWKALKMDHVPGYIIVDTENPLISPTLKDTFQFRYLNSNIFGKNLHRHVYMSGYSEYTIAHSQLYLETEDIPWQIVYLTRPTVAMAAPEIALILKVDPQSGAIEEIDPNNPPQWLARTAPEDIFETRNVWWGKYRGGYWNTVFATVNVVNPISIDGGATDANAVIGPDGQMYDVQEFTPDGDEDASVTGIMYVNTRTRVHYYYKFNDSEGPYFNASQAAKNVSTALGSNNDTMDPGTPIMHHIYGRQAHIVPIVSSDEEKRFLGIAIHDAETQSVFMGTDQQGGTKEEVLEKYRLWVVNQGSDVDPSQGAAELLVIEGTVNYIQTAVVEGDTVYYIVLLENPYVIFTGKGDISPWLVMTLPGDSVRIEFQPIFRADGQLDTNQPISRFRNVRIQATQEAGSTSTPVFTPTPVPTFTPTTTPTQALDNN